MQRVLRNSAFRAWDFDTSFIQKHAAELLRERTENAREVALAATIRIAYERSRREQAGNPWLTFDGFRLNHEARRKIEFVRKSRDEDTEVHALVVYKAGGKSISVQVGEEHFEDIVFQRVAGDVLEVEMDGVKERVQFFEDSVERELHLLFKNGEIATLA